MGLVIENINKTFGTVQAALSAPRNITTTSTLTEKAQKEGRTESETLTNMVLVLALIFSIYYAIQNYGSAVAKG